MTDDVGATALVARLRAPWLTSEILGALAATARAFATRFPVTEDGRIQITEDIALVIMTSEDAIEVQAVGAISESWLLHNVLTDLLRLLVRHLQSTAPDREVTLRLTRGSDVLASKDVTLDASAAHLVLVGPAEESDDFGLGTTGAAYLEMAGEPPSSDVGLPSTDSCPAVPLEPCITVPLHYATDRAPVGVADGAATWFGVERGDLRFGVVDVRVPRDRQLGALRRRKKWYQVIQFDEDARTHIHAVTELTEDGFYASLAAMVAKTRRRRVFVFVHGYNVSFDAAAERAAQLHVDLEFDGVPVLYSWPSAGSWEKYFRDSATIDGSRHTFAAILRHITSQVGADELHVLAHSMGSRAVARALELLALERQGGGPLVTQLIFAAPDVDAREMQHMLPRLSGIATRITIYGSSKDWPLTLSSFLAGWRRAGDGGANLLVVDGHAESIDASDVDTAFLAHSYVAENGTLLADMNALIERNESAKDRYGIDERQGGGYALKSRNRS